MEFHRNSQKRFYGQDYIYFVVSKTYNNYPYFKEQILCDLFIEELKLCKSLKKFRLYGFCIVYDHINLLLQPSDEFNISKVMQSIKKETSRDINYVIGNEGDIPECRLQGKQYSEQYHQIFCTPNLSNFHDQFFKKYKNRAPFPKFNWQKSYYDHVIRNGRDFENHWNYTSYNYSKHSMDENWRYCTENYWNLIDELG
jgi:REP element-mobilizing transposase RayT